MLYEISCYIGLRYNGTWLYLLLQEMSIFDILEVLHKPLNKFY